MSPNKPKTPARNVRVDDALWERARAVAESRGESLSEVIRMGLEQYVAAYGDEVPPAPRDPKVYTFEQQDQSHHYAPTGHADGISGRVRVRDGDLRIGDLLVWDRTYIVVDQLEPTNREDQIMRGHVDWDVTRERYGRIT